VHSAKTLDFWLLSINPFPIYQSSVLLLFAASKNQAKLNITSANLLK
jgi:hypothetical protein